MKGPAFCRRQKGGIFWPGLVLAARGAEKDFFITSVLVNCMKGQVKFTLARIINHLDFSARPKIVWMLVKPRYVKYVRRGKKGENVGFEICKTWEGTGRTFDPNISAGQPDLSLETLVQQQCPFQ